MISGFAHFFFRMDFKNVVYFEENKTISLQEFHSTCQKSRVKFWNYSKSSKNVKNIVVSAASLVKVRRLLKTWISAVASSKRKQIPFVITILFIRINVNLSALLSECQQKKNQKQYQYCSWYEYSNASVSCFKTRLNKK